MYLSREELVPESASFACTSSFEEEVVNLLLDMRDKVEMYRRTVEEGKVKREFISYEDPASLNRKRKKAVFDSDDSQDGAEDVEGDQQEEPEWRHEEDLIAEDDDDWMDAGAYSGASDSKVPRKKAPSGSACDKHKRWKKRCPEDCPMRKQKSKKRSEDITMDSDGSSSSSQPSSPSPPLSRKNRKLLEETFEAFRSFAVPAPSQPFPKLCAETMDDKKSMRNERAEKRESIKQAQFSSGDDMSPQECEDAFDIKEEFTPLSSPEAKPSRSQQSKPKRAKTAKHRSSRKYLPQACDRHKILHAKCPANCPDRLKRDLELAKQQKLQRTSSADLNPLMVQ